MNKNGKKLVISELKSNKPGIWFKFKVMLGNIHVADFETQIDHGYYLEGDRESVYTIYKMVVKNKYRRNKIGTQIIKYCEKLAIKKSLKKLVVLIHSLDKNISVEDLKIFYQQNDMILIEDKNEGYLYGVKNLIINS